MKHSNKISSINRDKVSMFHGYFCDQFSNDSAYDVDIDFSNYDMSGFDFSCIRVKKFFGNININKTQDLDRMHGCDLKYCSVSLCRLLSNVFRSFNTGSVLTEWKSPNIVPVHKKGEKLANIDQFL